MIYLLKNKSDLIHIFLTFFKIVSKKFNTKMKKIRSYNAHDYFNQILSQWFQKEGIAHESSCITTSHQIREEKNCHILKCTQALLF